MVPKLFEPLTFDYSWNSIRNKGEMWISMKPGLQLTVQGGASVAVKLRLFAPVSLD